ncbi:S8 family serine peptidase [Streptosporangiaceae bacterium NEAU-GS5]|nr:S8 family serine peptidase [Streptosporangiaceae bacterium NEAU-GS5]
MHVIRMGIRAGISVAALIAGSLIAPSAQAAAIPEYDPDTVIVKYRPGVGDTQELERKAGAGKKLRTLRTGAALLSAVEDPAAVAARLSREPQVEYAEPNYILTADAPTPLIPGDPQFPEQYGLHNTGQTGGDPDDDIDAPEGYFTLAQAGIPGAPVKVGIVDTGIDIDHEDLADNVIACARATGTFNAGIVEGSCKDGAGHGTHVAGILAADANGKGVVGTAFNARLIICKGIKDNLKGTVADLSDCINWVYEQGAKVVNMSFGGTAASATLHQAVKNAWQLGLSQGATLIASAGNVPIQATGTEFFPAAFDEVVSVAATDDKGFRGVFTGGVLASAVNADVEVAAPGVDIRSTLPGNAYGDLDGTSMASPFAAGVAAAIRARFPSLTAQGARNRLTSTTVDLGLTGRDQIFGFGMVNLCDALATTAAQRCN